MGSGFRPRAVHRVALPAVLSLPRRHGSGRKEDNNRSHLHAVLHAVPGKAPRNGRLQLQVFGNMLVTRPSALPVTRRSRTPALSCMTVAP